MKKTMTKTEMKAIDGGATILFKIEVNWGDVDNDVTNGALRFWDSGGDERGSHLGRSRNTPKQGHPLSG